MSESPTRAAIYARVSSDEQVTNTSLDLQVQQCTDAIKWREWTLALPAFREEGVSGTLRSRPEFDRLLKAARSGEIDVVVVARLDRLARLHRVYVDLSDQLKDLGVQLLALDSDYDTGTPQGEAMRSVQVTFAQLDRDTLVQKMALGARHKVRSEQSWTTSRTPFGYQHTSVVIDNSGKRKILDGRLIHDLGQVEIIRLAYTMLVEEAATTGEVAQRLNALGMAAPMGGPWTHGNLRRKMSSRGLLGHFLWGDPNHGGTGKYGDAIEVNAEPILTQDEFDALQVALKRKSYGTKSASRVYPLSGRLLCVCGEPFGGTYRRDRGLRQYACRGTKWRNGVGPCRARRINADWVEGVVWKHITSYLGDKERLRTAADEYLALAPNVRDDLDQEVARLDDKAARLRRALVRAQHDDLLSDVPGMADELIASLKAEIHDLAQVQGQMQLRLVDRDLSLAVVRDIESLADLATERLEAMNSSQRAAVIDLMDIRVQVLDPISEGPRRGGKNGGIGPVEPNLAISGFFPTASELQVGASGNPDDHRLPLGGSHPR